MDNNQINKTHQERVTTALYGTVALLLILLLSSLSSNALAQYDFNGDGIDELLHVSQTEAGVIQWQALDPVTGENNVLGYFGQAGDQLAVGNWLEAGVPEVGVITHGEQGNTANDERFRLKVPLSLSDSAESVIVDLQRGERASLISSADFDGNGISDVAVVRRGHKLRALWQVSFNLLSGQKGKKSSLAFGKGRHQPFTFYFRHDKQSLAQLIVPKSAKRAITIEHCRWPCKRKRRIRVGQDLVSRDNLELQVLRGGSSTVSADPSSARRDALVFIRETEVDQELTFLNYRGRPERKQSAPKGAAIVVGQFGLSDVIEINNGQAQANNNATGEKIVFAGQVNKPVGGSVVQEYPQGANEGVAKEITPLPLAPTPTIRPTATTLPTITPTSVSAPTLSPTPANTATPTATATASLTPMPTMTPTATQTPTVTVTLTPTLTNTPTITPTPTPTPTATINPNLFISTWDTEQTCNTCSASNTIVLPLEASGIYAFTVDWGDGSSDTITAYNQAETTHAYATPGVYTVVIDGTIKGFRFANVGDKSKIIDISQWGVLNVGNSGSYFDGCDNFNLTATDALDLTGTTSLFRMFAGASKFNGDIGSWDTSEVTNLQRTFEFAISFNRDLANWDTSSVTDMIAVFNQASSFNGDISTWDTSNVTSMWGLFADARSFSGDISQWNTSKVTNMNQLFQNADSFNSNLSAWDVSKVTSMRRMFWLNNSFNGDISGWDVSSVTDMAYLFSGASSFNSDISSWDTSNVTNMENMFSGTTTINSDISSWDTSKVTNMVSMFAYNSNFNQDISSWDTSKVMNMANMFVNASSFNQNLSSRCVSNIANEPSNFDSGATAWTNDPAWRPQWGTCP